MPSSVGVQPEDFLKVNFKPHLPLISGETIKLQLSGFDGPDIENFPIRARPAGAFTFATWYSRTKQLDVMVGNDVEANQAVSILIPTFTKIVRIPNFPVKVTGDAILIPEVQPGPRNPDFSLKDWHETPNTHHHDYGIGTLDQGESYRHRRKEPSDRKPQIPKLSPFEQMLFELENESNGVTAATKTEPRPKTEQLPPSVSAIPPQLAAEVPVEPGQNAEDSEKPPESVWIGVEAAPQSALAHTFTIRLARKRFGQTAGVGVMIVHSNFSNGFFVYSIAPEGPAARSCLVHVGDMLVAVDGVVCEGLTGQEVTNMISGEQGTWVELSLIPAVKVVETDVDMSPFKEEFERRCLAVCPRRGISPPHVRNLGIYVEKRLPIRHHQIIYIDPMGPVAQSRRVRVGDLLLRVDGEEVDQLSSEQVNSLLVEGKERPILLTLGDQTLPIPQEAPSEDERAGRYVVVLDPAEEEGADSIGITVGVEEGKAHEYIVLDVAQDSPADRTGKIKAGDRVLRVDGVDVRQMAADSFPVLLHTNWRAKIPIELFLQTGVEDDIYARVNLVVHRKGRGSWSGEGLSGVGAVLERVEADGQELVRIGDIDAEGPLGQVGSKLKAGAVLVAVDDVETTGKSDDEISKLILGEVGSAVILSFAQFSPGPAPAPPDGQSRWRVAAVRGTPGTNLGGVGLSVDYSQTLLTFQVTRVDPRGPVGKRVKEGDLLLSIDGIGLGYKTTDEVTKLLSGPSGTLVILTLGRLAKPAGRTRGTEEEAAEAIREEEEASGEPSLWDDPIGGFIKSVQQTLNI